MKLVGERKVWSVAEVAGAIFRKLEDVPSVWIEAEVTNLARRGNQIYLSLVDHGGAQPHQIDASMNAVVFDRLPQQPGDGALIQAYGRVEMWVQRSQLRFRVERIELTGDGLLLARIDELRRRLDAEGLTADSRKRPLPYLPRRIGLVTSGEGAARADFLTNVAARFPAAHVLVVRSLVQGDGAPAEIVRAIRHLDAVADVDVIVVARGGGALEDLMAFNSEAVCRAVAATVTPVVSAVGHESDVTVCDLVADLRVSTPTKAAEAVVPNATELRSTLDRHQNALTRYLRNTVTVRAARVAGLATALVTGLRNPGQRAADRVDALARRLRNGLQSVGRRAPAEVAALDRDLTRAIRERLAAASSRVDQLAALQDVLSPARTVARGYAIVRRGDGRDVVSQAAAVNVGDNLQVEFRDGTVVADVVGKESSVG